MAKKTMALKRDDSCSRCELAIQAGTRAQWDSTAKAVTCLACVETSQPEEVPPVPAVPDPPAPLPEPESPPPAIDTGRPGASARREFERRQARREQQIEQKWGSGRMGKLAKFLSDDPQSTKAWAEGATGEERVAAILHERLRDRAVLLHDRKVPKSRANIDHLAIAASGVWIIDAKKYKGKVEKRDAGGFFRTDLRLYVGGRDRTKAVGALGWQRDAVQNALGTDEVPIHCALSFVGAEWPILFAKPFQLDGVWISWPAKLADLIAADGPLDTDSIEQVAINLAERLSAN